MWRGTSRGSESVSLAHGSLDAAHNGSHALNAANTRAAPEVVDEADLTGGGGLAAATAILPPPPLEPPPLPPAPEHPPPLPPSQTLPRTPVCPAPQQPHALTEPPRGVPLAAASKGAAPAVARSRAASKAAKIGTGSRRRPKVGNA
eukprot:5651931-Prymnesium_polylepis.1